MADRYDPKTDTSVFPCPACGQPAGVHPSKTHNRPLVTGRKRLRVCGCGQRFVTYQPTNGAEIFLRVVVPADVIERRRRHHDSLRHEFEKDGLPSKYFVALARAKRRCGLNNSAPVPVGFLRDYGGTPDGR